MCGGGVWVSGAVVWGGGAVVGGWKGRGVQVSGNAEQCGGMRGRRGGGEDSMMIWRAYSM